MPEKKVAKKSAAAAMKDRVVELEKENLDLKEQLTWYKRQAGRKGIKR